MEYVAVCPGTSLRGLHDSFVNYLGNREPQLIATLHEESAVAIAHGYAKVTGKAMGVMTHANVGLLHASMSIYNAWCDRVPMLVIAGVGPLDSTKRRPWIDWIHTSRDLGAMVRDFTKWDDQPGSIVAGVESIRRAWSVSHTQPQGPTLINFDATLQEMKGGVTISSGAFPMDAVPATGVPDPTVVGEIAQALTTARQPLLLVGRVELGDSAWQNRVALAERFRMRVITDIKVRGGFPTDHPLHFPSGGLFGSDEVLEEFDRSDFILSLDWIDLGSLTRRPGQTRRKALHASCDYVLHRGAHMDYQALPTVDWHLHCSPSAIVDALLHAPLTHECGSEVKSKPPVSRDVVEDGPTITMPLLAQTLNRLLKDTASCLVRVPLRWQSDWINVKSSLDYLGFDGGFGLGSGPGMLVGAALALQGSNRLPVAVLGDGDTLMGGTAFWTAAHYKLQLLAIVANNASFYTDELHQERVAYARHRSPVNKWIGQAITDPTPDLASFARSLGIVGIGCISRPEELERALSEGIRIAVSGEPVLIDVRVHGA
jgi:thiamine pyrophosphate-dependent acetolactate synthase large subunit-like protein